VYLSGLVKKFLAETGAGLISGQWGTAKTFIAIDLSASVMMGTSFAGRAVKRKGGILFIAAEGAAEIPIRLQAVVETKFPAHKGRLPFAWAEQCPSLMEQDAIKKLELIAKWAVDRMLAEFDVPLVLIIIDTMSAAANFKDENASSEGQQAMNVLSELSRRTGALVLACDHFGKTPDTGTRGTSAKEASADVVIACLGDKDLAGNVANKRIAIRKLRSGTTGEETAFTLRVVDMGVDEDGEPITTCVVDWSPVTVPPPRDAGKGKGWPKSATVFRAALITGIERHGAEQRPFTDGPSVRAVELEKVHEEFDKRYPIDGDDRQKQLSRRRQVFKRSRAEAESRGLIGVRDIDGKFWVWPIHPEDGAMQAKRSPGQSTA
jgi:AAA domain